MGKISYDWNQIPLSLEMDTLNIPFVVEGFSKGVAVNIGNPHIVFFGKNLNNLDITKVGPQIENHNFFPDKTNVEFVQVLDKNKIKMKVWERGVGETLACGSGACSSVFAGIKMKLLSNKVEVLLSRGSLHISIENNEAIMIGPAEINFYGSVEF